MLLEESVSAAVQLFVVLFIAFAAWAIFGRKAAGFRRWIGLTAPTSRSMLVALAIFIMWLVVKGALFLWPEWTAGAAADNTVAGMLRAQGFSTETVAVIVVIAFVKTSLTEEIFFRGLIAKRLIAGFGFGIGNLVQALLFGAVHLLIFTIPGGPAFTYPLAAAFLFIPAIGGWLMAYANEKTGNGSIAPGWIIHGMGNAVSYPILAFLL